MSLLFAVLLAIGSALAPGGVRAQEAPTAVVDRLHEQMVGVMKEAATLGFRGRFDRLTPALQAAYDLPYMAEKAVGKQWDALDAAQRSRWVSAFERATVATYAGRMTGYAGQRFATIGEEPAPAETQLVKTKLIDPGHEDVDLNYRLRKTAAGWRIIDVYMQGNVSELALRRSDYTAVLERQGFDALVSSAEAKVSDAEAGKLAPSAAP